MFYRFWPARKVLHPLPNERTTRYFLILRMLSVCAWLFVSTLGAQLAPRALDLPRPFRSLAGIELNRDSALSLGAKLGTAPTKRVGSGHDTYLSWCYLAVTGASATTLAFMSDDSDMGTHGHAVNVIRLRSSQPDQPSNCTELPARRSLSTPGGLQLGLTRTDIERLLGTPTRLSGDSLVYDFVSKEFMKPSSPEYKTWNTPKYRKECFGGGLPYADVGATVTVLLRDGHVIELRLERYDQSTC
jgi:hypothetical protein